MSGYVDGSEVRGRLEKLMNTGLLESMRNGMQKACHMIETASKKNCTRVKAGTLRSSITNTVEVDGKEVRGYIGSNLQYAPYVHQGTGLYALDGNGRKNVPWCYEDENGERHWTKGMQPTPFISDAIDQNREQILQCFKDVLK